MAELAVMQEGGWVDWGGCLVKVGGVDTEMYRTGHSHASLSINLTAFSLPQLLQRARRGAGEVRGVRDDHVECGERRFPLNSAFAPLRVDTVAWSQSVKQEGRFREKSEDAAHLQ